jgi:hypothetical protein
MKNGIPESGRFDAVFSSRCFHRRNGKAMTIDAVKRQKASAGGNQPSRASALSDFRRINLVRGPVVLKSKRGRGDSNDIRARRELSAIRPDGRKRLGPSKKPAGGIYRVQFVIRIRMCYHFRGNVRLFSNFPVRAFSLRFPRGIAPFSLRRTAKLSRGGGFVIP